jgi:glycerophosphoryl diester phosphodiesterase
MLVFVILASCPLISWTAPPLAQDNSAEMPQRGVCAHRGASDTHPENTLAALREAVRLGAQMVEFDLALTRDREVVLMHDATIDRTTSGRGPVAAHSLPELKQLDAGTWKAARFRGEPIPTLREVLAILPTNIWLNLHCKGGAELATAVTQQVVQSNRLHQSLLACDRVAAQAARKVHPGVLICNMERQDAAAVYIDETIAQGASFIQLLARQPAALDRIGQLKQHGVRVNYCCTDDPRALADLFERGVDFVLVDRLDAMLQAASELGVKRLQPVMHDK